jgi:tryptophan 2,3-dioxygenase|nr:MAG: tryptophan 2,3-dioxygenase [Pseudomonadota bacterium]
MSDSPDDTPGKVDLSGEPVYWDLGASQSYGEYLQIKTLLSAQKTISDAHDEVMFITVHHVSELWIRLMLHELELVRDCVVRDNLDPSFKALQRVSRVQAQLYGVWEVLATMSPSDYMTFRNLLGRSSGFQSAQYRLLEFSLGNKNADMIRVHERSPEDHERLKRALHAPSLYDEVLRLLSRRGYGIPAELLDRDFSQPYVASKTVTGAWLGVYHNADKDWDLYELAEGLVDLDHRFQLWRFQHMKTVERIIGHKRGTGGTSGVSYLAKALELKFFPELWLARTSL